MQARVRFLLGMRAGAMAVGHGAWHGGDVGLVVLIHPRVVLVLGIMLDDVVWQTWTSFHRDSPQRIFDLQPVALDLKVSC